MKNYLSFWIVPVLILLTGCSTRVSTHHRHHNNEYRHHNHVSVGVHGRSSGAGILGALIVGGIIGSIIHDQQHQHEEDSENQYDIEEGQGSSDAEELTNGYKIQDEPVTDNGEQSSDRESGVIEPPSEPVNDEFQQAKRQQAKTVEWFQVGKDGKCYLMGVTNGVTDVIAAAPDSKCQQ